MGGTTYDFQISPSSWNRFEECPRKYWLSRQRLPRKASMAASMGTAIHNSVEDLCNLDFSGRGMKKLVGSILPVERLCRRGGRKKGNCSRKP